MLRKIKVLLYLLVTIATIALFTNIFHSYDDSSLPDNPTIVEIYGSKKLNNSQIRKWQKTDSKEWNKKYNKKKFFIILQKFAHSKNISLVKLRINNFNGHKSKIVYSFGNDNKDYSLYKDKSVKKLSNKKLQLEDLYGVYCTNAKNEALGDLLSLLHSRRLKARTEDNSLSFNYILHLLLTELSSINVVIFLGVISILFIVMVLEKLYRFKAYGIMKINGLNNWQLFMNDLKREAPLLVTTLGLIVIFIVVWGSYSFTAKGWTTFLPYLLLVLLILFLSFFFLNTLSYLVLALLKPYAAIKGEEHSGAFLLIGYLLKIVLLALIMLNAIALYKNYQIYTRDTSIIKNLSAKENGYSLDLSWHISNKAEDMKVARKVHKLVVESPQAIVSKNSQVFRPAIRDVQPENGNVITANKNFLAKSGLTSKHIKVSENNVLLLIPKNRLDQLGEAKKELKTFLKFQNKLPNRYRKQKKMPTIQVIPIASDQKVLNYTVRDEILSSISFNPLIIVVNDKLLSDDFYLSTNSQGMIRFPNLKAMQRLVKRLGLASYTIGITSQQALLSDYVAKANKELLLLTMTTIISLLQLIFIILFVSSTFLQIQRHKMAVYQVFGKSNAKLICAFLIVNLGFDFLMINLVLAKKGYLNLMPLTLGYLLIEAIIILLTYIHAQHNLLITLNHGN
ncbi:hypothetical protein [Lactobacillus sp. M0396]|uniref:hypothetical protein n=1 Tax=Lactobacillus sp. M0396 TaxID=2751030 RepID=UPI0018DC91DC|nr:hypothetical protein [Lactobacillus sp. M0396]MBI0032854.1 hypothetical protein [Lactobacillus sp. M0396]